MLGQAGNPGAGGNYLGGHGQNPVGFHGFQRIKEKIDQGLFQLVLVALNRIGRRGECAVHLDFLVREQMLDQLEGFIQEQMQPDR